jgi:hypothetical protein
MKYLTLAAIILTAITSFKSPSDNQRYFLIGYSGNTEDDVFQTGNFSAEWDGFPSQKQLDSCLRINNKLHDIVILSISEFKNKAEYKRFFKK